LDAFSEKGNPNETNVHATNLTIYNQFLWYLIYFKKYNFILLAPRYYMY